MLLPRTCLAILTAALAASGLSQQNPIGLASPGTAKVRDAVDPALPGQVVLGGLLGQRFNTSIQNRLLTIDETELLGGFRHRPGSHPWIGEHVGKWLHAASLSYLATNDQKLLDKMRRVAHALIATQEPDGYLGTYDKAHRFGLYNDADWDVWSHKYCLIGLLSFYQATHDKAALIACRRMGDLLIRTFRQGAKSIVDAGTHMGMAATSVLEPIVLLYRATGDERYLSFGKRIVVAYNDPHGPHLIHDLISTKSVAKSANGKAYEMLSNLVGLAELYRATGDRNLLKPVLIAWNDIAAHRLYITGTGSSREHWTADADLPDGDNDDVGETCVTVTWMQLNMELLRLSGEPKYGDELERSVYNHLLGSQAADGAKWCYYMPLNGRRFPTNATCCCLSSGPRGVALLPSFAYATRHDGVDVNLYGASTYSGTIGLRQSGDYPGDGKIRLDVVKGNAVPETIRLRIPSWAFNTTVTVNGRRLAQKPQVGSYLAVRRRWRRGDIIRLTFPIRVTAIAGKGNNAGEVAYRSGPLVLAGSAAGQASPWSLATIRVDPNVAPQQIDKTKLLLHVTALDSRRRGYGPASVTLMPFYQSGIGSSPYAVWLPTKFAPMHAHPSLFLFSHERASRAGNKHGSIADGDPTSYVVTYDGTRAEEDWYSVEMDVPVVVGKVVFRHGSSFHDGGWFDTSAGKPRVQVRRTQEGPWEDAGLISSYPSTNGHDDPGIVEGQAFECRFPPRAVMAIRIVGHPSYGDNSSQAFSSCSEIEAYAK